MSVTKGSSWGTGRHGHLLISKFANALESEEISEGPPALLAISLATFTGLPQRAQCGQTRYGVTRFVPCLESHFFASAFSAGANSGQL